MAESMVELTPSYELENQLLDDDHRRLVDLINAVVQALDEGRPEDCVKLVPEFVEVAKKHFKREEALLEHYGYPEIQKHRDHHKPKRSFPRCLPPSRILPQKLLASAELFSIPVDQAKRMFKILACCWEGPLVARFGCLPQVKL